MLKNSDVYTVNVKFWKIPLTSDNDIAMTLCDSSRCVGFTYFDNRGIDVSQFSSSSSSCSHSSPTSGWSNVAYEIWDVRFELSRSHTLAVTWSAAVDKGMSITYDHVLKPSSGLWLTACRHDTAEQYDVRFIEVTVRKAI